MTKEELYNLYLEWADDNPVLSYNDLFGSPITNIDVYEDENTVVNHMYTWLLERNQMIRKAFFSTRRIPLLKE